MATITKYIDIVVTGMEYGKDEWNASGHIVVREGGKVLTWKARHKTSLIIELDQGFDIYPELVKEDIKANIRSTLGYTNLPLNRTYSITICDN